MEQAAVSHKGLAALVTAEATRRGIRASPDHVSVKRWLEGGQPRAETARCISDVLSNRLNRRLTPADVGFISVSNEAALTTEAVKYQGNVQKSVDLLDRLTAADLSGQQTTSGLLWIDGLAPEVISGYLFDTSLDQDVPAATGTESGVAARIRATSRHLAELDFQFGGGHTRGMLLSYWKNEVLPVLRQRHPERERRELFAAAADAAEVLGWSAYDAGRQGAAQRYFTQGLALAQEAEDALMGGQLLSNLSHQANYLGRHREALHYARAAQAKISGRSTATVSAMVMAMEARALASLGDGRLCATVLQKAEREFDRRILADDPEWIRYFDEFEMAGEAAHCFRDLGRPAEGQASALRAIDPVRTPPRTRAFILMVSAKIALQNADLDEAVSLAANAVEMSGSVRSERYHEYLSDFYESLTVKQLRSSAVSRFLDLLRSTHPSMTLEGSPG